MSTVKDYNILREKLKSNRLLEVAKIFKTKEFNTFLRHPTTNSTFYKRLEWLYYIEITLFLMFEGHRKRK